MDQLLNIFNSPALKMGGGGAILHCAAVFQKIFKIPLVVKEGEI